MDSHKTDYLTALKYLLIPINLIFLIVLLLNLAGTLPAAFKTIYFFYFALIVDTIFLGLKINRIPEHEREHNSLIYYSKYLFLLTLIIVALNQFLDRQIVNDNMNYLVGFSIATGFLTFYSSRNKISNEIESEEDKEAAAETRRKDEFAYKFPGINRVWGLRSIVKWMYKEGWWYSGLFITIIVTSFLLKIYLATKLSVHIDEGYTHLVSEGLLEGKKLGTTITGIGYDRTLFFNWINTLPYLLFENILLKIRFLNLFLFSIFLGTFYFLLKPLVGKKGSLISLAIISFNWYIIIITLMARSYTVAIIFSFLSLAALYKLLKSKTISKYLIFMFLVIIFSLINILEGHLLGFYHLIPLIVVINFILFIKTDKNKRVYILAALTLLFIIALTYVSFIKPTAGSYILRAFNPQLRMGHISTLGSLFFYINEIGIIMLTVSLLSLFFYRKLFERLVIFWIILVIIFQGYVFGIYTFEFRYFFTILIPSMIVFSLFLIRIKKTKGLKILFYSLVILLAFTYLFNINNIKNEKLSCIIDNPQPWNSYLAKIPEGSILMTDFPIVPHLLRPDLKIYKLTWYPRENELINKELNMEFVKYNYTEENLEEFFNFIDKKIDNQYTIADKQEYFIYTGSPNIMSIEHIEKIASESEETEVYALFTESCYIRQNPYWYIFDYLLNNYEIAAKSQFEKSPFDNRPAKSGAPSLTLIKIN